MARKPYHSNRSRGDLFTLYPAYRLTGDKVYYDILEDKFKEIGISYVGRMNEYEDSADYIDKAKVAQEYDERCYVAGVREYYNTCLLYTSIMEEEQEKVCIACTVILKRISVRRK